MPQLIPFFFVNQLAWGFTLLSILIYITSVYILPSFLRLYLSRTFITKL